MRHLFFYLSICCSGIALIVGCSDQHLRQSLIQLHERLALSQYRDTTVWSSIANLRGAVIDANSGDIDSLYNSIIDSISMRVFAYGVSPFIHRPFLVNNTERIDLQIAHRLRYWGSYNAARTMYVRALRNDGLSKADAHANVAMEYERIDLLDAARHHALIADSLFERDSKSQGRIWTQRLLYSINSKLGRRKDAVDNLRMYRRYHIESRQVRDWRMVDTITDINLTHSILQFGRKHDDLVRAYGQDTARYLQLYREVTSQYPDSWKNSWFDREKRALAIPIPVIRSFPSTGGVLLWTDSINTQSTVELQHRTRFGDYVRRGNRWVLADSSYSRHTRDLRSCGLPQRDTIHGVVRPITNVIPVGDDSLMILNSTRGTLLTPLRTIDFALPYYLRYQSTSIDVSKVSDRHYLFNDSHGVSLVLFPEMKLLSRVLFDTCGARSTYINGQWSVGITVLRSDLYLVKEGFSSRMWALLYDSTRMTLKPLDIDIATTDSFMTSSDGRFVNFNLESLGIRFWRFNGGNTVYLSEFTTSLLIKNVRQEADAAPTRIHAPAGFVAMRHLDNIDIVDLKLNRTYPQHAVPVPDAVNSMTDVGIYRRSDGELRGYYHNGKVLTTFALSQMSLPFQVDVYVTKDNESPINLHHCSSLDAGAVYRLYTTTNLLTCESPMRAVIDNDTLNERSILNQLHLWCIECRPTFETDTLNVVSPQDSEMISIGISKPIIVHPLTLPITLSFVGILVITAAIENLRRRKHKRFLAIENAKSQQLELIREDMHDMIGSRLVRIASLARQTKPEDADAALARIHDMTVVTVRSLRNLLSLMSETIMTDAEFFGALREYVVESCTDAALSPTVTINTIDDDRTTLDGGARHELMMIVSEMLANTLRHAQARTVSFTMHSDAEGTTLNWQDDGVGIAPSSQRGNGLNNIQRRAARLDATVNLISHPGGGTQYTVTIPIQAS